VTAKDRDVSQADEGAEDQGVEQVEENVGSLRSALEEETQKAEKYLANWQRAEADLINYRKRTEQDKADVVNYANETLVVDLLPALDDLERALENVPQELVETPWVEGISLIHRKLRGVLEARGLRAIESEGKEFDPNLHEAVMCVEGEEGRVIQEVQKGYLFRDRVVRPSMVTVGKEGEGEDPGQQDS
jgi:molecular chaperone GrpE